MPELIWKLLYSGVILGVNEIRSGFRRRASGAWPEVQGKILAQVEIIPPGGTHFNARAGVSYYYMVNGEYYAAESSLADLGRSSDLESLKRRFARGTKLRVRYRPGKPTVAVAFPSEP